MAGIPRTKLVKDAQLIDRAQIGDSLHARAHAPATLIPLFSFGFYLFGGHSS
jgi:hypothetical protein